MTSIQINRAPVLTLWASVVAQRLGYDRSAALTFGKAVAGHVAQAKGRKLGIYEPKAQEGKRKRGEEFWVEVCGEPVPAKVTDEGVRAVVKDVPINPESVQGYLERYFGSDLPAVRAIMEALAGAFAPDELKDRAYSLYQQFRPGIPSGKKGWGAKGELDLDLIRSLAKKR